LFDVTDERDHDLGLDRYALLRDLERSLEDRARLHPRDLGIGEAEAAAAMAVLFFASPLARSTATSTISSSRLGRNSWSGGSRVRMVTGFPCISLKRPAKSARWTGSSFLRAPV